jgi:penicillin-binding protein 2
MTREQRRRLDTYLEFFNHDPDISASELLAWMRGHYGIDYTIGIADARLIAGVRYELEIRAIIGNLAPYVFAHDVSAEFITLIEERGLVGVHAETGYVREYHTTFAAHILGYIGPMSPEEFEIYRELGYPMDALVGKTGVELAFEEILRGVDGRQIVRMSESGAIMDIVTVREPQPGSHVYLTVDLGLQMAVEHALRAQIDFINNTREQNRAQGIAEEDIDDLITGGAVVVTDVRNGEVLASATYPTYDPMTLTRDFAMLRNDPGMPMFNRATQGRYSPGSTFKMVTAFAALRQGLITRNSEIIDRGRYTAYEHLGFAPSCWIFLRHGLTHGPVNVVQAIECSCNYFFIAVADMFAGGPHGGGDTLAATAYEFGLGRSTGLEIPENSGRIATREWKRAAMGEGWYAGDTLTTAFGQGHNMFTPVQLANYTATIANGGTLHELTLLRRVMNPDFTEVLHLHEPQVLNVIEETDLVQIIQEGMLAVSRGRRGTAGSVFSDYPVRVASKTGTVQVEGQDINDGVFVCYAPATNPEIAISVVIEKGGSGSAIMDAARMIFDYYFRAEATLRAVPFGELIP